MTTDKGLPVAGASQLPSGKPNGALAVSTIHLFLPLIFVDELLADLAGRLMQVVFPT